MIGKPDLSRLHRTTAVIVLLAAGESVRYGGIKQLASIEGEAMVHRTARIALASGAKVLVVTGAHATAVTAALSDLPLSIVHHPDWQLGMGSSLAAGVAEVQARFPFASGVLVCLADQPLLDGLWLAGLLAAHRRRSDAILVTQGASASGPPVLFPHDLFGELAQWSGPKGAQALLKRESHRVTRLESAAGIDVDTPDDLRRAHELLGERRPD